MKKSSLGDFHKGVTLLGSTGSIGTQTLDVIECLGIPLHSITALDEVKDVLEQIERYKPKKVCLHNKKAASELAKLTNIPVLSGLEGALELIASPESDIVVNAISGAAGLLPGLEAVKHGKRLASANKECFVMAGHLFKQYSDAEIIPVDSEHSALFQGILSGKSEDISRLILTASGGPFFRGNRDLSKVTVQEALKHPNWSMGPRITIDSATMFNKGLEVIEARWLFDIMPEKIDVVIHPQSIVHSIVEFKDNTQMAQMSLPDMRLPIQYALTYPKRFESSVKQLNLAKLGTLEFFDVPSRFPALTQAFRALELEGIAPTVANAADEIAVKRFIDGNIGFMDIPKLIEKALDKFGSGTKDPSIDVILEADKDVRIFVESIDL